MPDMLQIEVHANGISPTLIATDYKGGKAIVEEYADFGCQLPRQNQ